jgi:hypothetical protein
MTKEEKAIQKHNWYMKNRDRIRDDHRKKRKTKRFIQMGVRL